MRLRIFLLLIAFLTPAHSFSNRLLIFFFNDNATTDIYTLSLHDALPILIKERILVIILLLHFLSLMLGSVLVLMLPLLVWLTPDLRIKKSLLKCNWTIRKRLHQHQHRSEERFSRNAETDLVCRLLLEKKK